MKIERVLGWVYYLGDDEARLDTDKCGKWMYFFIDKKFVAKMCEDAVKANIVSVSKHSDDEKGVACFYLNYDNIDTHKKIIMYFIENDLIRRKKNGSLYNISFKLDNQTRAGEYGNEFKSDITLSKFVNLNTGEWLL
ncbi:hypothetical protein BBD42_21575 [Paenibacillus sp. BIHB 4019]|uniref:Uncharacterized protein n=1 Tax=Paenibacillus sp. BIHB 4019 TaxID=1870819 RepID=A0A1B2DM31_9BACL|nr:hypothetical protein [Paenibacillus sp. BIHB 4019]ANY68767.1 hypothetical protein BBD42_21575 [Paenibacillus sp. BIHB 4019]